MKTFVLPLVLILATLTASAQPIRLHPDNPHYFLFRGAPTVLITSGEHYGAVLNGDFDYRTYLDALAADSLNYTRLFTGAYVEEPGSFGIEHNTLAPAEGRFLAPWARSDAPGYAIGGNKFDLAQWDPAYFERLTDFVARAGQRGIVVEVTLFSSIYTDDRWRNSPLHAASNVNGTADVARKAAQTLENQGLLARQEQLVRKIVDTLREFDNVIYEIQNEPWADLTGKTLQLQPSAPLPQEEAWKARTDLASETSMAWQHHIAAVVTEAEASLPQRHLIAQNYCNFLCPVEAPDSLVSILNFHYAWPEVVVVNYDLDRVIGFDESGFAGSADSVYRRQAWRFILAGGGLFNNLDYSFTVGHEAGNAANEAPGGGSAALRRQLGVLKAFIHGFDVARLRPASGIVGDMQGARAYVLAEEGRAYALYLDGALQGDLAVTLPAGTYEVAWVNPVDGRIVKRGRLVHKGGPGSLAVPGYDGDVALRIVQASE